MNRVYVAIAIIVPALLVISGAYFYLSVPHEKPVVKLPTKYTGDIVYFPWGIPFYTCDNETPLADYWEREYLKNRTWTISADNITLTVEPWGVEGLGDAFFSTQRYMFTIILNSSTYVEKVAYILDARYTDKLDGYNHVGVQLSPGDDYENKVIHSEEIHKDTYALLPFRIHDSNFTMTVSEFINIDVRITNKTLPCNLTVYVETKDRVYRMELIFNLTDKMYPLILLHDLYLTTQSFNISGAKYFCYNSTWGKVVISDHLVEGTKYYFVEKDGILSSIWSVEEVIHDRGWKG